jgi:hypothetical protein
LAIGINIEGLIGNDTKAAGVIKIINGTVLQGSAREGDLPCGSDQPARARDLCNSQVYGASGQIGAAGRGCKYFALKESSEESSKRSKEPRPDPDYFENSP